MTIHLHILKGCSPAPLANYLKALGILRLVSQQVDRHARGWWQGEYFCLLTKLSRDELERFFLEKYEPTPLLSPWNKGCGFFKANDPGLSPLEKSTAPRFKRFREAVAEARSLLNEINRADAVIRAIKARTKTTAKAFQSDDQRKLLETDDVYKSLLQQLQGQLTRDDLAREDRDKLQQDMATVRSLTRKAAPPTKAEAKLLKESSGYKRLRAAADRRFKALKATLIPACRRLWRGPHAEWLSAAVVLDESDKPDWACLLGTGGNDGNLDFTNNFMQHLGGLFDLQSPTGEPHANAAGLLRESLWSEPVDQFVEAAIGQYQPGSAGGANSSTGFDGGNRVNRWDFVLMMEGAVLFTSRATRRLDPNASSKASAPFAMRPHAAGFATPGSEKQRGEQWMPLWRQPATLGEVATVLGEARIQLDRQPAYRPIDAVRAISRLGVARGIDAFVRYGYLKRNGESTLAVPLGRVHVRYHPRVYLIDDLAGWLDRLQQQSRDKNAPARLVFAERRLADAIFGALTHDDAPARWQAILLAAAEVEAIQATGTAVEAGPIPPLRPEWVSAAAEDSAEFRLAVALGSAAAGYTRQGRPTDPIRHHVLPLKEKQPGRFQTADQEEKLVRDPRVVVSGRDPLRDLAAVVERRLIEAVNSGQRRCRLVAARGCDARLDDLARFLSGAVDLERLLGLARAFMAIQWDRWSREHLPRTVPADDSPDECWLAVRLCCLPFPLDEMHDIPADERMVRLLIVGEAGRAIEIARQRLRSAGIRPPMYAGTTDPETARRWAAALAFPINPDTAQRIALRIDPSLRKGAVYG